MSDTKQELSKKIERMVGYIPPGLGDILSILTHPDVISLTERYIKEQKENASSS